MSAVSQAPIATILDRGAATGTLRTDIDPDDIATLLIGVFAAIIDGASQGRTDRLLDLLLDAVRPKGKAQTGV